MAQPDIQLVGLGTVTDVALLYQATLTPSKIDLLSAWIPAQPWLGDTDPSTLAPIGAYRFDDPDGQVGIETHLLRTADGAVLHVPVTYRPAPLPGLEESLIATPEHSVLGRRWVYDACADPVYLTTLVAAILTGGTQADIEVATDSGPQRQEPTTRVAGSGSPDIVAPSDMVPPSDLGAPSDLTAPSLSGFTRLASGTTTVLNAGDLQVVILRVLDGHAAPAPDDASTLMGTWPGQDLPVLCAYTLQT